MSADKDIDVPTIIHDKKRHEFRLTLQSVQSKTKVRQKRKDKYICIH